MKTKTKMIPHTRTRTAKQLQRKVKPIRNGNGFLCEHGQDGPCTQCPQTVKDRNPSTKEIRQSVKERQELTKELMTHLHDNARLHLIKVQVDELPQMMRIALASDILKDIVDAELVGLNLGEDL